MYVIGGKIHMGSRLAHQDSQMSNVDPGSSQASRRISVHLDASRFISGHLRASQGISSTPAASPGSHVAALGPLAGILAGRGQVRCV